MLKMLTKA